MKAVKPNSIVLDIGANFGAFALRLANHVLRTNVSNVQIHAFEPNPVMIEKIKHNLSLNPELSDIVYVHSIGMGNKEEKVPFQYEVSNSGAGRVIKGEHTNAMFVSIGTVDDFTTNINPESVSFIKMIVEGFEPLVFKGAYRTIQKYRPPIFFEVTPEWYKENDTSLTEIIGPLKQFGYSLYGEIHNELIPYDPLRFGQLDQYNMFALVE
jgi:FkbM family methyltransferase